MALRRFALVVLFTAACSSDSGHSGPIAIGDLAAAYNAYACNAAVRCGLVESVSVCRSLREFRTTGSYGGLFTDDDIGAAQLGAVTYDGAAASQCLGSFFSTCDRTFLGTPRARTEACDHIFTATLADQQPCAYSGECISKACSFTANCMGTCIGSTPPAARPHVGEACALNSNCIDSFCDGATRVCLAYLKRGDPCNSDTECEPGLAMRNGTCEPLAATGATCTSPYDCASVGDQCTGTCTKYGLTGEPCVSDSQCAPSNYRCDNTSSTCVLGSRLGEGCTGQAYCIDESYCDSSTFKCVALLPDGSSCNSGQECESTYCDFSTGSPGTCSPTTTSCF